MTKRLDLLLINPGVRSQVYGKLGSSLAGIEPPLWCALLAVYIRKQGYSVQILDAEADNLSPEGAAAKISDINPVLAAIIVLGSNPSAASTPKMTAAGELLRALKKQPRHIPSVIGGLHPSALPELTLKDEAVDYVAQGEGFITIRRLLEVIKSSKKPEDSNIPGLSYRKNGKIFCNPPPALVNPDELPMAAWDLLSMDKYRAHNWHCFEHIDRRQPYAIIYTSLGCPYNCTYCNIHALYNDKPGIRFRSPEQVVEEIDYLVKNYKVSNIKFMDELFAISEERVIRLCDMIASRGYDLNIWAYARVDTVSEKMLQKMKQAGIRWVGYGFESASEVVRQGVTKRFTQDVAARAVELAHNAGLYVNGNFIFGLPDDNMATMRETLDMAKRFQLEYVNFYAAMAYPGSALYNEALEKGIKLPEVWHGYGQFSEEALPMPTKYLTAGQVLRFRDEAFKEYFNNPAYLEMINRKFGPAVVTHIQEMLRYDIKRRHVNV